MTEMHLRPDKLPELRARQLAVLNTEDGILTYNNWLNYRISTLNPRGDDGRKDGRTEQALTTVHTLSEATLFHVSAEMSRLAVIAGQSLEHFHLRPWDLPSEQGLIWFDSPIDVATLKDGTQAAICAAAWTLTHISNGRARGVQDNADKQGVAPWVDKDRKMQAVFMEFYMSSEAMGPPRAAETLALFGPLTPITQGEVIFGDSETHLIEDSEDPENRASFSLARDALLAAWLLMSQQVADVVDLQLPRSLARQHHRRGYDRKPVRVVLLAPGRMSVDRAEGESKREWPRSSCSRCSHPAPSPWKPTTPARPTHE